MTVDVLRTSSALGQLDWVLLSGFICSVTILSGINTIIIHLRISCGRGNRVTVGIGLAPIDPPGVFIDSLWFGRNNMDQHMDTPNPGYRCIIILLIFFY